MKSVLCYFVLLVSGFVHLVAGNVQSPHAKLLGVWAYGENVTDSVTLDYKQNNLRFFCGTEEELHVDSVEYRIMLKGHEDVWKTPFRGGWYFYTDLSPGNYEFVAQCRTTDGEWGGDAVHSFTIVSPLWTRWWAIALYVLAVSGILIYIYCLVRTKLKMRNQLLVERRNFRFRSDFIIHAAREFRTPLTIIRTTVDKLSSEPDHRLSRTDIQHLRNSSRMLMQQLENLVEFRKNDEEFAYRQSEDILEMVDIPINRNVTVMIVETDLNLADVMRRALQKYMNAVVSDGRSAIEKGAELSPDAIVIDTELNDADGYSLLHEFKSLRSMSRVPVILVSDFVDSRSLLKAVRSEADDYLEKPFSCEVLAAIIMKKVRANRSQLLQTEGKQAEDEKIETPRLPILENRKDKKFLERLDHYININISDAEFDVNTLAEELDISRAQLYKKVKALCGMSPVEYLRDVRLKKASALLCESSLSVKKIRFEVGMPDATYFNRRFKEKFEVSPTVYRETVSDAD